MNTCEYTKAIINLARKYDQETLELFDILIENINDCVKSSIIMENYLKFIKKINKDDYTIWYEIISKYVQDDEEYDDIQERFVLYVLTINDMIGINYMIINDKQLYSAFNKNELTYFNLIMHIKKYYTSLSMHLKHIYDRYFQRGYYASIITAYINNKTNIYEGELYKKNIVYMVANIGGIINKIQRSNFLLLHMNTYKSCQEDYDRLFQDNAVRFIYKYDKFSDVYNLHRKVFI